MTDVSGTWKIKGHRVLDDTKEAYMKITDFGMRPNVGHMDINMSNLVNGNPELSEYLYPNFCCSQRQRSFSLKVSTLAL
jgi:Haemolymph juvenile hormone binding protein (JHBP).